MSSLSAVMVTGVLESLLTHDILSGVSFCCCQLKFFFAVAGDVELHPIAMALSNTNGTNDFVMKFFLNVIMF
jgi:hypothetical protein